MCFGRCEGLRRTANSPSTYPILHLRHASSEQLQVILRNFRLQDNGCCRREECSHSHAVLQCFRVLPYSTRGYLQRRPYLETCPPRVCIAWASSAILEALLAFPAGVISSVSTDLSKVRAESTPDRPETTQANRPGRQPHVLPNNSAGTVRISTVTPFQLCA